MHGFSNLHSGPQRPSSQLHLLKIYTQKFFTFFYHKYRSVFIPKRTGSIYTIAFVSTFDFIYQTFVYVIFTIHTFESGATTLALIMANQIDTTATILAWIRFTFIDIRLAMNASVTEATLTRWCIVGGQTKSAILTWFVFTEWFVA